MSVSQNLIPAMRKSYSFSRIKCPLNESLPKDAEISMAKELEHTLIQLDSFETQDKKMKRVRVMGRLNYLFLKFIEIIMSNKKIPEEEKNVGGIMETFGSYRMGVEDPQSDIDALCIVSRHISKFNFFNEFYQLLKKESQITDLRSIEEAYVPLIKLSFNNIDIDLLYCQLFETWIPYPLDVTQDDILMNMDPQSIRSLNGVRVTQRILKMVPNVENFKLAFRAIKLWAKKKKIYGNTYGYLGGVSWSIMLARVCQLYPNAVAATLTEKFFLVYSTWVWPRPVLLDDIKDMNFGFPVWNAAVNPQDRLHLMPIITPCYPHTNSSYNVSKHTMAVIQKEINLGFETIKEIVAGVSSWDALFQESIFFGKYKTYLMVEAKSSMEESHRDWQGLVQSKLRHLLLEFTKCSEIESLQVNPVCFSDISSEKTSCISRWFIGIAAKDGIKEINLSLPLQVFKQNFLFHVEKHGLTKEEIRYEVIRRKDLKYHVPKNVLIQEENISQNNNNIPPSVSINKRKAEDLPSNALPDAKRRAMGT